MSVYITDKSKFYQAFALLQSNSQQEISDLRDYLDDYLTNKLTEESIALQNKFNNAKLAFDSLAERIDQRIAEITAKISADQAPVLEKQQAAMKNLLTWKKEINAASGGGIEQMQRFSDSVQTLLMQGTKEIIAGTGDYAKQIEFLMDQKRQAERWVRLKATEISRFNDRKRILTENRDLAQGALDLIDAILAKGLDLATAKTYDPERLYQLVNG